MSVLLDNLKPSRNVPPDVWPKLHPAADYGLADEIVKEIEPVSEADPVALKVQFLAAVGCVMGRSAFFSVESDRHHSSIFANLVGVTGRSRKGTSIGHIFRIIRQVDPDFARNRICGGLGSGEGLIYEVRDAVERPGKGGEIETIPGVDDKRTLVHESEFSKVLRVSERHGSILSEIIRQAYDTGDLKNTVKGSSLRATDSHISIVGHITKEELLRRLSETDTANGFANRFMFFLVRRSKMLPEGGFLEDEAIDSMAAAVKDAVEFARMTGRVRRDAAAGDLWRAVYPILSSDVPGLFGSLRARAEAHVVRLSLIFALLDLSPLIRAEHLAAAIAVWCHAEESLAHIFGDSTGDPIADAILRAIRRSGEIDRTAIHRLGANHWGTRQIEFALSLLEQTGRIAARTEQTEGRSREFFTSANCELGEKRGEARPTDRLLSILSQFASPTVEVSSSDEVLL